MNKIIINLLFLSGLCYGFESSHQYTFEYASTIRSMIPDQGTETSGFALTALVHVFVENNDGIALINLSKIKTSKFFEGSFGGKILPKNIEDEDLSKVLEQPFRANLRSSDPFSIEYEKTEHRWLTNVRKGIVSLFRNEILKSNYETQVEDSISKIFHQGHLVNTFKIKEETLFGICTANYEIHQIPFSIYAGDEELMPSGDEDTKDLWRVERSIDFDDCSEIVSMHIHTTNNRRHKDQKLRFQRSSQSTYILTGSPGHFELYSAFTEGSTRFPLSLFSEDRVEVKVKQEVILIDHKTEDPPLLGQGLESSRTWMYEVLSSYPAIEGSKPLSWVIYPDKDGEVLEYEKYGIKKLDPDQIAAVKVQVLKLVKEVSFMLTDISQLMPETLHQSISEKIQVAANCFRFLKKEDILKIFDYFHENSESIEMDLVIDAALSSGFPEPMEAIMDYITEDKLDNVRVSMVFMMLTRTSHGFLNTSRIMDYLLDQELSDLHLNFAHYLSEFCIHKVHNYIPIAEGFACGSSLITERFIPYLKTIIYNESLTWERSFAVKTLSLLRSNLRFEILSPLIDGSIKSSAELKTMALKALENWYIYPKNTLRNPIMDLLSDVYTDVSQDLPVRAAALNSFVSWEPSTDVWYSLALSTFKEPSKEFAAFVTSLIKIYAEGELTPNRLKSEGASFAWNYVKTLSKTSQINRYFFTEELYDKQLTFSFLLSKISRDDPRDYNDILISIVTNIEHLLTLEIDKLYLKNETLRDEILTMNHSHIPHAKEFLNMFMKEIHLVKSPHFSKFYSGIFIKFLNDIFISPSPSSSPLPNPVADKIHKYVYHLGKYLQIMHKSDFHPNELGFPTFIQSSLPAVFSLSDKNLLSQGQQHSGNQVLLRFSSTYTRGISVSFPWSFQSLAAMVRSDLEITLPVQTVFKRSVGTEGHLRTETKTSWKIFYKKKFPLFRVSNTPVTAIYDMDPREIPSMVNIVENGEGKEKTFGGIESYTGLRYDIKLKADAHTNFGPLTLSLLQFPKMSLNVWSFDLYLNLEESTTKELLITKSTGLLLYEVETEISFESTDDISVEELNELDEISYNDSFERRSEKLRKLLGDGEAPYTEWKFSFIGNKTRKYEIFYAYIDKIIDGSKFPQRKYLQTLGATDVHLGRSTICFNLASISYMPPVVNSILNSETLTPNVPIKYLQFNVEPHCPVRALLSLQVAFNFTEERLEEMKNYCNNNYREEKCYVKNKELTDFDIVKISFIKSDDDEFGKAMNAVDEFVGDSPLQNYFSQIFKEDADFYLRRNSHGGNWDLSANTDIGQIPLTSLPSNFFEAMEREVIFKPQILPPKCTINAYSVETFDGVNYGYKLSNCWTLVSHIYSYIFGEAHYGYNVFLIRKPQGKSTYFHDFKYILFKKETEIEFSNNELKVNGTVVDTITENKIDALVTIKEDFIYRSGSTYIIFLNSIRSYEHLIIRKDRIELFKEEINENTHGICGNGDGNAYLEFLGPKHCLYNGSQAFVASWTGHSDNCDVAALQEFRKEVDEYQNSCEPIQPQFKDIKLNSRCLISGWRVLKLDENSYCISAAPLPSCSETCQIKKEEKTKVTYKCWPKEEAPELVKNSIENKVEIVTSSFVGTPFFYHRSSATVATLCKRFI